MSVGTASAECAWVLWFESRHDELGGSESADLAPSSVAWAVVGAFSHEAKCRQESADKVKDNSKPSGFEKIEVRDNMLFRSMALAGDPKRLLIQSLRYLCLPDPADPPPAKGK